MKVINNLPVVILAGGQAKRMGGEDKALIRVEDRPLLSHVLEKISGFASPIGLNINKNFDKYLEYNYPIIKDKFQGFLGPLSGIFSALTWASEINEDWVLTLPCDTPYIPKDLIPKIIELAIKESNNFDVISVKSNKKTHPVIGLWKTKLKDKLENSLKNDIRKIDLFTSKINIKYVDYFFDKKSFDPFLNLNSPMDILNSQQILGNLPPICGLAGWSGSGKTTLCKQIINKFTESDLNIGCIKHAHHNFELDIPGKDSYEIRKSGAAPMIISSKKRFGLIHENKKNNEKNLFEIIDLFSKFSLKKCDLIIVEGYKNEPIQKIEIHRHELNKPLLFKEDDNIFAIASNKRIEANIPLLDLNNIDEISDFIINKFQI